MKPSNDKKRRQKLQKKEERKAEQTQKLGERKILELKAKHPKFDSIKLLSLGEGTERAFANRMARRYLEREDPGQIVTVDLKPLAYSPPSNLTHVVCNAIDFLKILPNNSVGAIHDHFAAHMITNQHADQFAIAQDKAILDQASAGNKFYREIARQRRNEILANAKLYVSHVKRVLKPGGKFVLANDTVHGGVFEKLLNEQGFKVRKYTLDPHGKERFGLHNPGQWMRATEKLRVLIASKTK